MANEILLQDPKYQAFLRRKYPDLTDSEIAQKLGFSVENMVEQEPAQNQIPAEGEETTVLEDVVDRLEEVWEGAVESSEGILAGGTKAVNAAVDLVIGEDNRKAAEDYLFPNNYVALDSSRIGEFSSDVTQSLIGIVPAMKLVRALGVGGKYIGATIGGAVGEFVTADEELAKTVLDMFKIIPKEYGGETALAYADTIAEWMDEPDGNVGNLRSRLVVAAPGVVIGPAVQGILDLAGKALRAGGQVKADFLATANAGLRGSEVPVTQAKTVAETSSERILQNISPKTRPHKRLTFAEVYTRFIDRGHPLGRVVKELKGNEDLAAHNDPYKIWRTNIVGEGRATAALKFGPTDYYTRETMGRSLQDILKPVHGQLKEFTAYSIARRAMELEKRNINTNIDMADRKALVGQHKKDGLFAKTFEEVVDYQNNVLKQLADTGVLTKKQYEAILKKNKDYVPMYREMDDGKSSAPGARSKRPIKTIKGVEKDSTRNLVDPLESIISDTYRYSELAERNRMATAMIDLDPNGLLFTKLDPKTKAIKVKPEEVGLSKTIRGGVENNPDELTIFRREAAPESDRTFVVYNDGKAQIYEAPDPEIAAILNNAKPKEVGYVTKVMNVPARVLRAGAILDPAFFVKNMMRDNITAAIYSKSGYIPVVSWLEGFLAMGFKSKSYKQWVANGGANATFVDIDRKYLNTNLEELTKQTGLLKTAANVVNPLNTLRFLRFMSDVFENSTRVGEFKAAKRQLGDGPNAIAEAAYRSREVTLDFARMGDQMRAINMISAFTNARVQGWDRLAREFRDNPKKAVIKSAMLITAPAVYLWFDNHSTPEKAEVYRNLPDWQKDIFFIVQSGDTVYRIPKAFEQGIIFGTYAERILDIAHGETKMTLPNMKKAFLDPLWSDTGSGLVPQALSPLIENLANYDIFRGGPLIPRDQERLLSVDQQTIYTSESAKAIARGFDDLGVTGRIVSPIGIENFVGSMSGTLGRRAFDLVDRVLGATEVVDEPALPRRSVLQGAFLDSFIIRYPNLSLAPLTEFWNDLNDANKVIASISKRIDRLNIDRAKKLVLSNVYPESAVIKGFEEDFRNLRKSIDVILVSPKLLPEQKTELTDKLIFKMVDIANKAKDIVEKMKKNEKEDNRSFKVN